MVYNTLKQILHYSEGTVNYSDDIFIYANSKNELQLRIGQEINVI